MVYIHHKNFTKKMINKAKHRSFFTKNNTRKLKHELNIHPEKYLSAHELYRKGNNSSNFIKKLKSLAINHTKLDEVQKLRIKELKALRVSCIKYLGKANIKKNEIILKKYKKNVNHFELLQSDIEYYLYKEFGKQYDNYKICHYCNTYDILNVDKLKKHFGYIHISSFTINPSHTHYSFCVDFIGNRNYHFFMKNIYEDRLIHVPLHHKNECFVSLHKTMNSGFKRQMDKEYFWVDDTHILYISLNTYYNTSSCYVMDVKKHKRKLVYSKKNEHKQLSLMEVHSSFYYLLFASTYHSDEVYLLDVQGNKIICGSDPILRDKMFVKYPYIDHINALWYILKEDHGKYTFMTTYDFKTFSTLFVKKQDYLDIQEVVYLNHCFVFFFRYKGKPQIYIYSSCHKKSLQPIECHPDMCKYINCHYHVMNVMEESGKIFFHASSFTKPNDLYVIEIDKSQHSLLSHHPLEFMESTKYRKKKQFDFCEEVVYLQNNSIMITKIYKKGLSLKNTKCLVYGYGAYGDHYDATFNAAQVLNFCEKGYLVVITQISGDGTLGFKQRRNGMLQKKKNSFHDFIYVIREYLFKQNITSRDKLAIWGRSAGGLLIGAVLNMCPDICKVAILGVPFVTPLLAMKSSKNPLGFESHSEWGNPFKKDVRDYIQSYSPYENINKDGDYPHILIYSNLNDTLVPYTEAYNYYKALKTQAKVFQTNQKQLFLHMEDKFGHSQGSSYDDRVHNQALVLTFLEKHLINNP